MASICKHEEMKYVERGIIKLYLGVSHTYSKTYVKQPLKNRQNKGLNDNW